MKYERFLHTLGILFCLSAEASFTPISLPEAATKITAESQGTIQLSASAKTSPIDWHFFMSEDLSLKPSRDLNAEYVQSLFDFNPAKFISLQKSENFLDAKEKYYRGLRYSFAKKRYLQNQTTLSDWSGLNHPPIHSIADTDLTWITATPHSQKKNERNTEEFHLSMDQLSDSELTAGNTFKPFVDQAVVPELLSVIKNSKKTLWGSALLFACDENTQPIISALEDRADQGVDVRLMLDQTLQLMQKNGLKGSCQNELRKHGIKVVLVPGMLLKGSAFHVKLWMSDFEQGLILGANLIDIQTQATGFNHLFHDSGMVVHGPMVTDMAQKYQELWQTYVPEISETDQLAHQRVNELKSTERKNGLRGYENYQRWFSDQAQGLCRVVTQERHQVRDRVSQVAGAYLKTAHNRIWFTSVRRDFNHTKDHPEIGYNELLLNVLSKARDENVQVEMLFNAGTNPYTLYSEADTGLAKPKKDLLFYLMSNHLNHSTNKALRDGSDFFEKAHAEASLFRAWSYFDYSHMKNLLIDDDLVLTGSYNPMDERSTDDAEIAVFCQDHELSRTYTRTMARDLVNSIPYPYASQISK